MFPYFLLFSLAAAGALSGDSPFLNRRRPSGAMLFLMAAFIAAMIGFRYRVGGDWGGYVIMYNASRGLPLATVLQIGDPAYQLLNWLALSLGLGLWFINLVCGMIFSWGLYRLARIQPEPWLALVVAVPYLVIVVAMGYSRQAVAIGIIMAGLARLMSGGSFLSFIPYAVGAALFHKTALVVIPLCLIGVYTQNVVIILVGVLASYYLYSVLLAGSLAGMVHNYLDAEYSSQGAVIRESMIASAALAFFLLKRRMRFTEIEEKIWRNFSVAAISLAFMLFILSSSTVVDRLALYLLPLQFVVLSRIPLSTKNSFANRAGVISLSLLIMVIWLNFAANAWTWVPYRLYSFGSQVIMPEIDPRSIGQ